MLKTDEKMGPVSSCDLESTFMFTKGLLGLKCIEKEETLIPSLINQLINYIPFPKPSSQPTTRINGRIPSYEGPQKIAN